MLRSAAGTDVFIEVVTTATSIKWFTFSIMHCQKSRASLGFVHEYFSVQNCVTLLNDDYVFTGILLKLIKSSVRDTGNFIFVLTKSRLSFNYRNMNFINCLLVTSIATKLRKESMQSAAKLYNK